MFVAAFAVGTPTAAALMFATVTGPAVGALTNALTSYRPVNASEIE